MLIGKHKATYQPNVDAGDSVRVQNASKMIVTGKKLDQKTYFSHSRYAAGLKQKLMGQVFAKNPAEVLERSVSRMLPKNSHRNERMKRLIIKN